MKPLTTCILCPHRQKSCSGPCVCTIDGRDIMDHAAKGDCPLGKFDQPDATIQPPAPAAPPPIIPIPRDKWPLKVRLFTPFITDDDAGMGDVMRRVFATAGIGPAYKWALAKLGMDCGCDGRRAALNARYPLP